MVLKIWEWFSKLDFSAEMNRNKAGKYIAFCWGVGVKVFINSVG